MERPKGFSASASVEGVAYFKKNKKDSVQIILKKMRITLIKQITPSAPTIRQSLFRSDSVSIPERNQDSLGKPRSINRGYLERFQDLASVNTYVKI